MVRESENRSPSDSDRLFCRASILYIDDDGGLCRLLQKRLARVAYSVAVALDGQTGLDVFAAGAYDVVITDYNMPGIDGLEVLRRLKDRVPVVILTGQGDEKVAVSAMKLGAADYLAKDIGGEYMELLPSIIDRVLERQQLIHERCQAQSELEASEARYRAIVEDQTELICRFEAGGQLTFANAAFCRFFNIRAADIPFQKLTAILSRKNFKELKETLAALTPQKPVTVSTLNGKMVDGQDYWLQWTGRAIFNAADKLREYQIVGRDVTELEQVAEALKESKENINIILSALPDVVLRLDQQGNCVDLRAKNGDSLQLSADVVGKNIAEFLPADVVRMLADGLGETIRGDACAAFRFRLRKGEGVSCHEARLVPAGKNQSLAIIREITDFLPLKQP